MNDEHLTAEINKSLEHDLKTPLPRSGNGQQPKAEASHRERINTLITDVQMTLRILEEAKKRL